ncbi:hypothetical protein L2E82_02041 [Cichorium intybus]|uniref:Uncharacterized protein n=1 Tax=Cichorium intybus TaxID=13427 RepID=A0ACB9H075_CICIN|nr:hypothetical protein L2E82_02041 [Cichorium intybus]
MALEFCARVVGRTVSQSVDRSESNPPMRKATLHSPSIFFYTIPLLAKPNIAAKFSAQIYAVTDSQVQKIISNHPLHKQTSLALISDNLKPKRGSIQAHLNPEKLTVLASLFLT